MNQQRDDADYGMHAKLEPAGSSLKNEVGIE